MAKKINSSYIDKALSENLDKEGLLKLKAIEYTIAVYLDRPMLNVEQFCQSYDLIHNLIKDDGSNETVH